MDRRQFFGAAAAVPILGVCLPASAVARTPLVVKYPRTWETRYDERGRTIFTFTVSAVFNRKPNVKEYFSIHSTMRKMALKTSSKKHGSREFRSCPARYPNSFTLKFTEIT